MSSKTKPEMKQNCDLWGFEGYFKLSASNILVKEKNKTLFLRADKEVPYGVVVDVMGRIKAVGIEKLGVVADSSESLSPAAAAAAAKGGK